MGLNHKKKGGQKSRDTLPLKTILSEFENKIYIHKAPWM